MKAALTFQKWGDPVGTLFSSGKVTGPEGIIVMNSIGTPHINQRTPAIIIIYAY